MVENIFAGLVQMVAKKVTGEGKFGRDKVFVAALDDARKSFPTLAGLTTEQFKSELMAAHRAGKLVMSRADLTSAMSRTMVAMSEIRYLNAEFHFVTV